MTIKHSRWRFGHPPSLIRTALYFYHRATNLRDQPLNARKDCLDSNEYEDALSSLLKELYELVAVVGRPVVQVQRVKRTRTILGLVVFDICVVSGFSLLLHATV